MSNYKIISESDIKTFELEVSKLLNEYWQLAGGVSVVIKGDYIIYTQALVKIKYSIMDGYY